MNYFIIVLAIIIIFLIYYIYSILNSVPVIIKSVDLTQSIPNIPSSSISNAYSTNYTIGVWVYVANFTPQIGRFLMYGDTLYNGPNSLFSLRMDTNGNNLYADILVNKIGGGQTVLPVMLNSTNSSFPIQKWVYVCVCSSYNYIEGYLNGKFTTAVNISNNTSYGVNGIFQAQAPNDVNAGATFYFGGQGTTMDDGITIRQNGSPVVLSQLSRWDTPLTAGDIYNNYMKGNGQESGILGEGYNMDIVISQGKNKYGLSVF
jgi:hypothetical protein